KNEEQLAQISECAMKIKDSLGKLDISVNFDDRDTHKPGWKFAEHELKGVPVRIAIGPRDLENGTVEIARRDIKEKQTIPVEKLDEHIPQLLDDIQSNIFNKAKKFREDNTHYVDTFDEFKDAIENKGGFVMAHWDGTEETEQKIKQETKATVRCILLNGEKEEGKCVYSGNKSTQRVVFAKAY
ncbi:MAG: proline--tRNA ligase, partial [Bacteroidia bacterium]|nr:proline--tRNA ligase [Bacteroidia bacterium]